MHTIKCGKCRGSHTTVVEVRSCYANSFHVAPAQSGPVAQSVLLWPEGRGRVGLPEFITDRQMSYLTDILGADPEVAKWYTKSYASTQIERLKKEKGANGAKRVQQTTKIPLNMLTGLTDGYYATRQSAAEDWMFFRVSHPKKNQLAGATKIQTQHGPQLKEALIVWPSGQITWKQPYIEDNLLLVAVDPNGCGLAYAEQIGRCFRCGLELTDPRSRWYGIGPDCEKIRPDIIDMVNDRKGVFVHGS